MSAYTCKGCGAPASVADGVISRACACNVGVFANMDAVAYGEGRVKHGATQKITDFARWFAALLKARPA